MVDNVADHQLDPSGESEHDPKSQKISGGSPVAKDARAVANYLIEKARRRGLSLTPMQIIKLAYIAHGWNLAVNDGPLFHDPVEAWRYGPVVPSLYQAFKSYGCEPIERPAYDERYEPLIRLKFMETRGLQPISHPFNDAERDIMDVVLESYGHWNGPTLSALTHQAGTPWSETYDAKCRNSLIDQTLIKKHFKALLNEEDTVINTSSNELAGD